MALIKCPDCGRQVSDQATTCPDCARPLASAAPLPAAAAPVSVQLTGACASCGGRVVTKNMNTPAFIGCMVVGALVALAAWPCGIFFVFVGGGLWLIGKKKQVCSACGAQGPAVV